MQILAGIYINKCCILTSLNFETGEVMLHLKAHRSLPQNLATVFKTGILISLK